MDFFSNQAQLIIWVTIWFHHKHSTFMALLETDEQFSEAVNKKILL